MKGLPPQQNRTEPAWNGQQVNKDRRVKGIIFDMDNTLLQSRIDFPAMKRSVYDFLAANHVLSGDISLDRHTTSTLIEHAKEQGLCGKLLESVMELAARHELAGMEGAGLEPGARELLDTFQGRYVLVVITNNSYAAALRALEETGIIGRFDLIVGREQMTSLKPSPSGFHHAMSKFTHIVPEEWISVGDSWIDGKASADAGVTFICYRTDPEVMLRRGVVPSGRVENLSELLRLLE